MTTCECERELIAREEFLFLNHERIELGKSIFRDMFYRYGEDVQWGDVLDFLAWCVGYYMGYCDEEFFIALSSYDEHALWFAKGTIRNTPARWRHT
jgi:hypothetical protein